MLFTGHYTLRVLFALSAVLTLTGCGGDSSSPTPVTPVPGTPNPVPTTGVYQRTNLVADKNTVTDAGGTAAHTDANLTNPWGIAFSPAGPFWIANNGSGTSTLYNGTGAAQPLVVNIPTPTAATGSTVTGQVFNGTGSFAVTGGPAKFIFASEEGTITGWANGTTAVLASDQSASGAVYKGLALTSTNAGDFLYATNFHSGQVDVFNSTFQRVRSFTDTTMEAGFAPFGIQNVGGNLIVTFARQDAAKQGDVAGAGNGFVDVFDLNGTLLRRLVSHGALNSPWGIALAPTGFGFFSGALLIGNFGDGRINAYNLATGASLGPLNDSNNAPITISGLWALTFGNGGQAGSLNTLFYTAGINDEKDGIFGKIEAK